MCDKNNVTVTNAQKKMYHSVDLSILTVAVNKDMLDKWGNILICLIPLRIITSGAQQEFIFGKDALILGADDWLYDVCSVINSINI